MKNCLIIISALLLASVSAFAQGSKGRIVDASGAPVPGVMILDTSNDKWATTDADGNYSIEAGVGHTLSITCLGYASQEVIFDGKNLDFTIAEEALELDEAVAIGYGSVKKKDLTGAVGVLGSQLIEQQSVANVSQSLQGTIPGLMVTRSSSMPGASASIKIRGVTTLSDNDPLILVDGMAVNDIDNISPNDIEQITVLKDGASASIYGARAAAGVILITTKSAKEGDISIDFNGEVSMITASEWAKYETDPITYMKMFNEYKWNDAGNPEGGDYMQYTKEYIDNYWKNAILKDMAVRQKYALNMSYGNKVIKTRASASYENTGGLYPGTNHERIMARVRNNIKISKHLSGDVDFSYKHAVKHDPQVNPIKAANQYPSLYLGQYPDGRIAGGKDGSNTYARVMYGGDKRTQNDYLTMKIGLSYKPIKDLDISAAFTPTYSFTKTKNMINKVNYYDAYDVNTVAGVISGCTSNDLTETRADNITYQTQVTATYDHSFNQAHNLNVMAGFEQFYNFHETLTVASTNMDINKYPYMDLANKDNPSTDGSAYENAYRSYFGRVMYNYKNRYYVQANFRADGSSRFAPQCRWGFFPSASLGWVLSEEKWLREVRPISYMKLRASVGSLGNERIGNYPYQAILSFNNAVMYDASGNATTSKLTAYQLDYVINNITWETTYTYDIGLDFAFLDNRLSLSGDYYYKRTLNMLLDVKIPSYTGFGNPSQNAGTMNTNGWEAKIDWKDKVGDFTYSIGFNISDYKSIMGNLNGTYQLSDNLITIEGAEYKSWYGYRSSGIFQNQEQIDAAPTQLISTLAPGDIGYKDISGPDGKPDGQITATYDKEVLGSSLPHFLYGGYINLGWKGLALGIMFNGVGQQWALMNTDMVQPFVSQWLSAPSLIQGNYFSVYNTPEQNAAAKYPRLSYTSSDKNNYYLSDYWLFNGAYFRIKNINLSYTFPSRWMEAAHIKGLKVYFNADDPFCFSNYPKGWDPEQTASSYIARTFTFGLDIKF